MNTMNAVDYRDELSRRPVLADVVVAEIVGSADISYDLVTEVVEAEVVPVGGDEVVDSAGGVSAVADDAAGAPESLRLTSRTHGKAAMLAALRPGDLLEFDYRHDGRYHLRSAVVRSVHGVNSEPFIAGVNCLGNIELFELVRVGTIHSLARG